MHMNIAIQRIIKGGAEKRTEDDGGKRIMDYGL